MPIRIRLVILAIIVLSVILSCLFGYLSILLYFRENSPFGAGFFAVATCMTGWLAASGIDCLADERRIDRRRF